jgi:hypothetical protein
MHGSRGGGTPRPWTAVNLLAKLRKIALKPEREWLPNHTPEPKTPPEAMAEPARKGAGRCR